MVQMSRRFVIHAVLGTVLLAFCTGQASAQSETAQPRSATTQEDHQHDFDFEFGSWTTHIRRLIKPLTGSDKWMELDGTSVVRKVWDGRANLGELNVSNPTIHLQGLSFRLYNPETQQWSIYWANAKDGDLGKAMVGKFKNGRGEFYDQETYNGVAIFVRFIFSDITPTSFRLEQAFSADGGKTWEPNWVAFFSRPKP